MRSLYNRVPREASAVVKKEDKEGKPEGEPERTANCPKCGEIVSSEMKFCPRCGVALVPATRPPIDRVRRRELERPEILGFVSAGAVLILIGVAYIRNPIEPSVVVNYLESMANQRTFIKPPSVVLDFATFLLYAAGVWGIILSGLRVVIERSARKALGDLLGGLFSLFVAFILGRYAVDAFTGRTTLAYFVVGIGLLVVANAIIHLALRERR